MIAAVEAVSWVGSIGLFLGGLFLGLLIGRG